MVVILVGMQFIPTDVNQQEEIPKTDFRHVYNVPNNVMSILQTSCYDCHSNNTNYPWYSNIQPIRFLMDKHIREGKEELNFNEFGSYSDRRKKNKLKSIIGQIKDEEMPPLSYTFMHGNTHLLQEEKIKLIEWIINLKFKKTKKQILIIGAVMPITFSRHNHY